MTVFSGHRWRFGHFSRRHQQPQPPQQQQQLHQQPDGQPINAESTIPADTSSLAVSATSNASNSTVHQKEAATNHQARHQQLHGNAMTTTSSSNVAAAAPAAAAASNVAAGFATSSSSHLLHYNKPPRQQIIIPGDAEDAAKLSDEEPAAANQRDTDSLDNAKPESNECPTGKHKNKKDAVCSCILLAQFGDKLATPVISEWHSSAALAEIASSGIGGGGGGGGSGGGGTEDGTPASSTTSPAGIPLSDFKLARSRVFQGGQGVVYIVRRASSIFSNSEELVMKFKERRKKQRTKSWKRDLREVFLLKDLRHPFIIDLKHAYLTQTFYCLVMDYGSRGSLWSLVCRHGCMPKPIAAYYVACILSAVRYVHKNNFIFRDLKAENVVVMPDLRPKLIDFGMAKSHNKPSVRNTSTSFYFAAYIAPEVYADPKGVTEKVDSWGIGYLALELTVGLGVFKSLPWSQTKHTAPEWRFEMPKRCANRISRDACRFIEKALDRRPEKRPSLDQLMDFQFFEDIDFRLLPSLKPKGIDAYLAKKAET